ncbi:MAG: c-type cytochrome [Bryobacteraceae bacterium]|nr:c-type cytochrome [Bryobacteraceae bacterium]
MKIFVPLTLLAVSALLAVPGYAASDSEKLYENSCTSCHGSAGEGNRIMDQFYKVRIPRLNSADVEKMTDAHLTNVILNGKRKMPPAMAAIPTTLHRTKITAEQVPGLIVYVRTLNKK